ncbi:divergent polysaccharide deacetylase family protein [Azospirillum argentinense]|uniref:Divergent polysaccharide deacetylase family protein n=1 Tax=Azospirillum argentinense TaxID=2970906 RepID=A0A5B0KLD3_9PROT|nr:divergent polysaccharide deacetylase family protein [Azospirillum argentinense]KAA1053467.1 Putative periplasmic protein [Azospirillum argentinense]
MAKKTPRKPQKAAARKPSPKTPAAASGRAVSPVLLALAGVIAVFAVALGARFIIGRDAPETESMVEREAPVIAPASPIKAPPPKVAEAPPPPPPVREAEPVPAPPPQVTEAPAPVPVPAPPPPPAMTPKPVVAMLPPPVAPLEPPKVAPGSPLWKKNALPFRAPPGKPAIAIVIDDMGVDRKRSNRAVSLPAPLTLAWLPYAHELPAQARAARAAGHELMLHLPMEPSGSADPGPQALRVSLDKGEILRRTKAALDSFDGYVGVNNHMGSRFTADSAAMAPVLGEIARRGLLWLDSRTTAKSAGLTLAREFQMPFAGRDIFLDNEMTVSAVRGQLAKTEQVARRQGYAIAIGHPHDATIDALASWMPEVQKRGFVLVPVSAVVRAHHAGG